MSHKTAIAIVAHDDHHFLDPCMRSLHCGLPVYLFRSDASWNGDVGDCAEVDRIARSLGAAVITGHWPNEEQHRNAAYDWLRDNGFDYVVTADGDEIFEPSLLDNLLRVAEQGLADRVYGEWNTHWRSAEYVIRPREPFTPIFLAHLRNARYERVREFSGGRPLLLNETFGIVHHMSYAGPDCRILRKITSWGHRNEIRPGWYERVWLAWPQDKTMRNLHPTHPENYGFAEKIHIPDTLRAYIQVEQEQTSGEVPVSTLNITKNSGKRRTKGGGSHVKFAEAGHSDPGVVLVPWFTKNSSTLPGQETGLALPSVSVVIPLHGGEDDISHCLQALQVLPDLVLETIVVDNSSPDNSAEIVKSFSGVNLVELGENKGFAAGCNEGIKRAKGDVILLLNSDAVVPRAGLIELLRSLGTSGAIAAAGPFTNQAGHGQHTAVTYTSLDTLDLFAEDFAARDEEDKDVDMLVGFCMAVKRSMFEEVGLLDEDFGIGTFEDNDLCYRLRRAGYRLVLSGKSFIHHEGSKTLRRMGLNVGALLASNQRYFLSKWKEDLECGFVNTLSGLGEALQFHPSKSPERRRAQIRKAAKRADISLCMIARDEERNIGACLDSIKPFLREMIVVDTGSKDATREIAREKGAVVYDFPWTNSFSEARNESLKYAKGRWIFWMDADDTINLASGEALIANALSAPPGVAGFVVPVRFTDDGPAGGVQVDHVKLFRNSPKARFQFHIHEQILSSIKGPGKEIARSSAFVLHSGYDTSLDGQKKKRARDKALLKLDLEEFPEHPFVLFNCGMTAHYVDEHEEAVQFLTKSIDVAEPDESHVRKSYALLAGSLNKLNRCEEAFEKLEEGLQRFPQDPELHFLIGQMLAKWGRLEQARAHYTAVLEVETGSYFSSVDRGILGFKTLHNRADIDMALGNYAEAKQGWLSAVDAAPTFTPSMFSLFAAALKAADLPTARQMLDRVRSVEGFSESWCSMAVQYGEFVGGQEDAEERLWQAAKADPHAAMPRLILARRLLDRGDTAGATRLLNSLQQLGVAEGAFHLGVLAERMGNYKNAFQWMSRAEALNPGHIDTLRHLQMLKECLEESA